MTEPLYELDPTSRFSARADAYARYRPDYPPAAISEIVSGGEVVVDVGAGTGISSRAMAMRGARVIALEPNAAMRAAAEPHPLVAFADGTAESIPLPDASADVVTAFQAFHWFRPDLALPEFSRVLRPDGRLAVVWNERNHTDPFTAEYGAIIRDISNNHPAERREMSVNAFLESELFRDIRHTTHRYEQKLDLDGLIGRSRSASYVPSEGEGLERLLRELTALFTKWSDESGRVTLIYRTELWIAAASPR